MRRALVATAVLLLLAGCRQQDNVRLTVLIGGTTIPNSGAKPIEDSIVVIAANKIRSVGERRDIPVPQNSDRVDLKDRWIIPAQGSQIAPGQPANLLILSKAPNGLSPADAGDVTARMNNGEWSR